MTPFMQPYVPARKALDRYLDAALDRKVLTNQGPLVRELTTRLEEYLGVRNLLLVASGTMGLQIAYRALGIGADTQSGARQAVTTPFTFVATASSLQWEGIQPQFADIDSDSLNLSPELAAARVSAATTAIVPVHVYGNPCDVGAFAELAGTAGAKLIFDAAHCFGITLAGRSILQHGDASVISFHATKIFHTVEGGGIVFNDNDARERAQQSINFGLDAESGDISGEGVNGKMSEVHAAFGLAMLDDIDRVLGRRAELQALYLEGLPAGLQRPQWHPAASQNAAYMPVLFATPADRDRAEQLLADAGIATRRYFSPCLGTAEEISSLPVAASASARVLCLPLYAGLADEQVEKITAILATHFGA